MTAPLQNALALAKDLARALGLGLAAGLAMAAVCFAGGWLLGANGAASGLEAAKDGLFLAVGLVLLVLAGMLLTQGKRHTPFTAQNGWRRHFALAGPKTVAGLVAAGLLCWAVALDYIQWLLA